jgi:BlaI family transcriptional regulator, penicillinase repressor
MEHRPGRGPDQPAEDDQATDTAAPASASNVPACCRICPRFASGRLHDCTKIAEEWGSRGREDVRARNTNYFVDKRINSYDTPSVASRSLSKEPAPPPLPTDAEIAILAVLWRQGASTVREVHETLAKDSGYTTTLKLMQLMFEKGLVVRNERFRSHLYEARAPKEQTQRQMAGDLLKRAFEGSAKSLVLGALAAQPASGKDLAEIRSLLDEFEKRGGKK